MQEDNNKHAANAVFAKPVWLWVAIGVLVAIGALALVGILRTTDAVRTEAQQRFFQQYNQQQLLLAKQTAHAIQQRFSVFRRNLGIVAALYEKDGVTAQSVVENEHALVRIYEGLKDTAIIDLVVFDKAGTVAAIRPHDSYTLGRNYAWRQYYQWAKHTGKRGQMYLSPFMRLEGGQNRGDKALFVAHGVYGADEQFLGVIMFTINFDQLARDMILPVRIGEHGFAWLVDNDEQKVLVDPLGRVNDLAFKETFMQRWPDLYDLLITTNDGLPGVGEYTYADPVDAEKPVHKLVGYQPVKIEDRLWTLGVATPTREVDAQLSLFLQQQERFSGTLMVIIFTGTFILCSALLSWNHLLSREVSRRTADLAEARARLEDTFDELLASQKLAAVGHLALGLAHEIRNPLTAIRMNMQMIRKRIEPEGLMLESFDIVDGEITRLNHLVNDVMDFARVRPLRLEPVKVGELLHRALRLNSERLNDLGVEVEVVVDDSLLVVCDPEQIEQVLLNLLSNAIEAMAESDRPKRLRLLMHKFKPHVSIQIIDSGMGIKPEDRDKIFDPFFTTKSAGGGLGLPTLQGIVLRHQGSVTYDVEENGDSCFTVLLPIKGPKVEEESSQ